MKFYSTNNNHHFVDLQEAVLHGLPSDNGLYMPEEIHQLPADFYKRLASGMSLAQIGFEVLQPYVKTAISDTKLKDICDDAFSFKAPLIEVKENIFALELYHGPTLAFKDFGARFMARLLGKFKDHSDSRTTILVATSGDTGSAVADGFFGANNVDVVILFPQGKVSELQERQMTTLGKNIYPIAINGSFDDCQELVKMAFLDKPLSGSLGLTSANSINIARLLPQMIYYFHAIGQLPDNNKQVIFSVPSGNYGNLTAGVMAKKMGLAIDHFLAATNANDIIPRYLSSGNFIPKPSIETISNAMDVGNPSNYARLQDFYKKSLARFQHEITGYSYSDNQTRETIKQVYTEYNYILDPHGAIGYRAINEHITNKNTIGIFLETAHPIKFREVVEAQTHISMMVPPSLRARLDGKIKSTYSSAKYQNFKDLLIRTFENQET